MSAVTPEIAADFLIEAQEILDRLGEQLVALEQAPGDSGQLNAVFRGFHTLKGGAGFLGIHAMVQLCHAAEESLGAVRAGQATLEPHHFDAAQQSLDYLQRMLDAVGAGEEAAPAPMALIEQFDVGPVAAERGAPAAPAPSPSSAEAGDGMIGDDEFEALLDQLHASAPGATPAAAATVAGDPIDPDEFEALLDQLHGGAAPGAVAAAVPAASSASVRQAPPPARPAAVDPAAKPAARASEAEHTIRVDTKRLDAIVNLVGELVLSRNRLKTLRARIRDEELDRAVSGLDIA
ncbi:MAG TPA: Hpt domain-containing protein, partial [Pseudoxanthomonas sp.]|nr:Hpt domain-containing protein [Pseudoxanthomonas sp.]